MGPDSQASMDDWGRIQTRLEYDEREEEPSPMRAEELSYVGGLFSDISATDRQALDPSDLEVLSEGPENDSNSAQSDSDAGGNAPPHSPPTTPLATRRPLPGPVGQYLTPDGFDRYIKNRDRRDGSRSSAQSSDVYRTAQGSPQSVTTVDEEEGENGEPIERAATPYFTPSHTPSHRSLATEDPEDETHEDYPARGPQSPNPWSTHHSHQFHIAQRAVDAVDREFTGNP